jgi:hypothetical protein
MTSYEFQKYLSDYSNIKTTIETYGVAIIPLLSEEECNKIAPDRR